MAKRAEGRDQMGTALAQAQGAVLSPAKRFSVALELDAEAMHTAVAV